MPYLCGVVNPKSSEVDRHYSPIVASRLDILFAAGDWDALVAYLGTLSNAHFRTAGYIIGERLLPAAAPEVFWEVMLRLTSWQPKAFTVTMAKAAVPRLRAGTLSLDDAGYARLARALSAPGRVIDREKLLRQWLPAVAMPESVERLFDSLHVGDPRRRIAFLVREESLAAGFVLLRTLRFEEHDRALLVRTCRELMRRGTSRAFNLASIVRAFFGLEEVGGVFSLQLEPYEFARVDTDFAIFVRVVCKV